MHNFKNAWRIVVSKMDDYVSPVAKNLWINNIIPLEMEKDTAVLYIPSVFQKDIILTKYGETIRASLSESLGFECQLKFYTEDDKPDRYNIPKSPPPVSMQDDEDNVLEQVDARIEFTFNNFVVGSSNRFAYAACMAVAAKPAMAYNPLFIYGGSGLGKTHLLQSIGFRVKDLHPSFNIVYVKGDDFTNELIESIREGQPAKFRAKYRKADLLLVDDVQFIGGRDSTQEEFFHTFNTLYEAKKQIVLVSDRPPKEIQLLEERLRTRFESGLIADVQAPDYELRMAIVQNKAKLLRLELPEEVLEFIATRLKNNIRQLEGTVKKILAYQLLTGCPPSLAVATTAIKDILNENEPVSITVDRIITEIARFYQMSPEDIKSQKRTADITLARQVSMYIIREITGLSLPNIGDEFNGRDHSTVHHSLCKIENDMAKNSHFKNNVNDLIKNLRQK